ncbi:hypothetical protein CKU38_00924 [Xanthomonas citri pv. fuscans]|nr:hypothetical protein CKU38_00924 [Xanthomonas citri pv. fuscans]
MRGVDVFSEQLFTVKRLDDFIPGTHPLRPVREMVNAALRRLDGLFERMYEPSYKGGRPSIAPEKLARAMLLQVFYSIRSVGSEMCIRDRAMTRPSSSRPCRR